MTVVFVSAEQPQTSASTTVTVSITVPTGADRFLIIALHQTPDDAVITGVTFNGTDLTFGALSARVGQCSTDVWYLAGPDEGTHDLVLTLDIAPDASETIGVAHLVGVDSTTPTGTFAVADDTNNDPTVDVSSDTDELVVGFNSVKSAQDHTAGAGQTERYDVFSAGTQGTFSDEVGAATTTHSYTIPQSRRWALVAVGLKPAVAAVGQPMRRRWGGSIDRIGAQGFGRGW